MGSQNSTNLEQGAISAFSLTSTLGVGIARDGHAQPFFARAAPKAIAAPGCRLVPTRAGACLRMGECLIFCVNSLDCLAAGGALGFSIITRYVSEQLA